ncbi:MAG: ABC transporter substrate-binding protein [Hyphomonadaceae bacterium]|nr:ABC transporter substrate-binding protein [Hyphomonadaceae bacterium]
MIGRLIPRIVATLLVWGMMLPVAAADATKRPQRIVSMNLCTDELLMRLVEPERIASISYLSLQPLNAPLGLDHIARKLKGNNGLAEEVLMAKPDLIVAGSFTTTAASALLRRIGYTVVTFEPENNFDDLRANIRKMGEITGEPARAEQLIAEFDKRLAELQAQLPPGDKPVFADIGVNNYLAGKDTFYAYVVNAGGWRTLAETLGYSGFHNIPLEELLDTRPALVSNATPWANPPSMATENLKHPALRTMLAGIPQILIPERYTTCGTPSVLGAVELLVEARKAQAREQAKGAPK